MKRKIHYVSLISQPDSDLRPKKSKRKMQVALFSALMIAGMAVSLIIPLRPTVSESEKRELAKFPKFSVAALVSGEYFDGIDTWFSDTFPFRETLTNVNTKLTSWYGFGDKVSSMSGTKGDDIPDAPTRPSESPDSPASNTTQTGETETASQTENTTQASTQPTETESTQENTENTVATQENTSSTQENTEAQPKKTETLGGILVAGKSAYEYYNFVQSSADSYINIVNKTAKKLKGTATVYNMLIPTSIDITLDDATRKSVSSSDQKKAIEYFYGSMTSQVKTIEVFDAIKAHRKEYIYFRTDHHWTAKGAYYAYVELAKAAGKTPVDIEKFEKVSYGEFLGSFYSETKQNKKLKKNADELIAYKPYYSTTLNYTDNRGNKYTWPIINDVSDYNVAYKYSCFAAGDQPYAKVVNNEIEKGPVCVVIKESFGNALIPFMAGNYKKIYIIDYRYWKGDIYNLVEKNKVDDVFIINNMSATRNKMLIEDLGKLLKIS